MSLSSDATREVMFSVVGLSITGLVMMLLAIIIHNISSRELRVFIRIQELIASTWDILQKRQDIYEILSITESIYTSLKEKNIFHHYSTIDYSHKASQFNENELSKKLAVWWKIINLYLLILQNLRTDMVWEFEKKKKELNSGISELKNLSHIDNWIAENSQIQQARLDKQIEQFEELQRVLVKV